MSTSNTIGCFVCSELDSIPCPNDSSDYASWRSQTERYTVHDINTSNDGLSCSIVIGSKTTSLCFLWTRPMSNIFSLWEDLPPVSSEHHPVRGPQIQAGAGAENSAEIQRSWQQSCGRFNESNCYLHCQLFTLFSVVEQMAVTGTKVTPRATAPLTKPLTPAPATWWWAP